MSFLIKIFRASILGIKTDPMQVCQYSGLPACFKTATFGTPDDPGCANVGGYI